MAKILKVKIQRASANGGTKYTYPPEYDASKIELLCYESVGEGIKVLNRTDKFEYAIGVVSNADALAFLVSPDIIEMAKATAITNGRKWRPQVEKITDNTKVISVLAKVARKETLTKEDEDALDPDNPVKGIGKSRLFDDLLEERLNAPKFS